MKKAFGKKILGIVVFFILSLIPLTSMAATPGNNLSTAGTINLNTTIQNTIKNSSTRHYYKLVLTTGYVVRFSLSTNASDLSAHLTLYDSTGKEHQDVYTRDASNWGYQSVNVTHSLTAGTYYLNIYTNNYKTTNYTLVTNVLATENATQKIGGINNYYINRAVSFTPGQSLTGVAFKRFDLTDWNPSQFYAFTVYSAGTFSINVSANFLYTNYTDSLWIYLYNSSGSRIGKVNSLSGTRGEGTKTTSSTFQLNPGTYYISATSPNYNVLYTLSTSFKTANPVQSLLQNPLLVKGNKVSVKYNKLRKKNQTIPAPKAIWVKQSAGHVSYRKTAGNKNIKVASNGKITLKRKMKKGTYRITVLVTAAGNTRYKSGSQKAFVTIKVK